jgi:YD repeat-containing protein
MYKKIRFPAAAFLLAAVFILPACTKLIDYLESHPGADPLCSIQDISSGGDTLKFTYNHDGNPVTALRKTTARGDNWYFYYDRYGRMIASFAAFDNATFSNGKISGTGDWYHKYTYDRFNTHGRLLQFLRSAIDHHDGASGIPGYRSFPVLR